MSIQFKDTPAACQYPSRDIVAELSPPSLLKPVQLLCLKPHNMTSDYVYIHNYIYSHYYLTVFEVAQNTAKLLGCFRYAKLE